MDSYTFDRPSVDRIARTVRGWEKRSLRPHGVRKRRGGGRTHQSFIGFLDNELAKNGIDNVQIMGGTVGAETGSGFGTVSAHNLTGRRLWANSRVEVDWVVAPNSSGSSYRIFSSDSATIIKGTGSITAGSSASISSVQGCDGWFPFTTATVFNVGSSSISSSGVIAFWNEVAQRFETAPHGAGGGVKLTQLFFNNTLTPADMSSAANDFTDSIGNWFTFPSDARLASDMLLEERNTGERLALLNGAANTEFNIDCVSVVQSDSGSLSGGTASFEMDFNQYDSADVFVTTVATHFFTLVRGTDGSTKHLVETTDFAVVDLAEDEYLQIEWDGNWVSGSVEDISISVQGHLALLMT